MIKRSNTSCGKFQSTHPLRGATSTKRGSSTRSSISIHAPLAGCDKEKKSDNASDTDFNPRTPCGVRRAGGRRRHILAAHFNPRTPCGVRLCKPCPDSCCFVISIHAPLAGCDRLGCYCLILRPSFQSTHPLRGATHHQAHLATTAPNFNPRTPCGVRPYARHNGGTSAQFQSTHPLRGATIA